jgi:hypothetical protein
LNDDYFIAYATTTQLITIYKVPISENKPSMYRKAMKSFTLPESNDYRGIMVQKLNVYEYLVRGQDSKGDAKFWGINFSNGKLEITQNPIRKSHKATDTLPYRSYNPHYEGVYPFLFDTRTCKNVSLSNEQRKELMIQTHSVLGNILTDLSKDLIGTLVKYIVE